MLACAFIAIATVGVCAKINDAEEYDNHYHTIYAGSGCSYNGLFKNIVDEGEGHGPSWYKPSRGLKNGGHSCFTK